MDAGSVAAFWTVSVLLIMVPGAAQAGEPTASWGVRVLTGTGVSGLDPKALLLFLTLLPQFTDPEGRWPLAAQIGALGLVHTLSCGLVHLCAGVLARAVLAPVPPPARSPASPGRP